MQFTFTVSEKVANAPEFYRLYADFLEKIKPVEEKPRNASTEPTRVTTPAATVSGSSALTESASTLMRGISPLLLEKLMGSRKDEKTTTPPPDPVPSKFGSFDRISSASVLGSIEQLRSFRPFVVLALGDAGLLHRINIWDDFLSSVEEEAKKAAEISVFRISLTYVQKVVPELIESGDYDKLMSYFQSNSSSALAICAFLKVTLERLFV